MGKSMKNVFRLCSAAWVGLFFLPNFALAALVEEAQQSRPSNPPISIPKRVSILDPGSLAEPKVLYAGRTYLLRVNTDGMSKIQNELILYYGRFAEREQKHRLVEFHVDKKKVGSDVSIDPSVKALEWTFTLPDTPLIYDRGYLRLFAGYSVPAIQGMYVHNDYYELDDLSTESAIAINGGAPKYVVQPKIAYVGSVKTDSEISGFIEELKARFLFATKGYVRMNPIYVGRWALPADGASLGNPPILHSYVNWWNGLSHDLSGTSLLPLDPSNPQDLEKIRLAWYEEDTNAPPNDYLRKDIEALLQPGPQSITLTETNGNASNAQKSAAIVGLYNPGGLFKEYVTDPSTMTGTWRYGLPQGFGWLPREHQQKFTLHEYGHTLGLSHPSYGVEVQPNSNMIALKIPLDDYAQIMSQGALQDYPTDLFYGDKDIQVVSKWSVSSSEANLPIPDVMPLGDPWPSQTAVLSGKKTPGSGISVNGIEAIAAGDVSSSFEVPVSLISGSNRFDVAERALVGNVVRESHPNIVYTSLAASPAFLPTTPTIQFASPLAASFSLGSMIKFTLSAKSAAGLKEIKWWIEKRVVVGGGPLSPVYAYKPIANMIYERKLYGSALSLLEYLAPSDAVGQYKIRALAMDRNLNQSTVIEASFALTL